MKYVPLIWLTIWRKPVRTILILLQVALAFALFGVLQGMKSGVDQILANIRGDLLYVLPSLDSASPLPVSYGGQLKSIPGVKSVTFAVNLIGSYQSPANRVGVVALEKNDTWQSLVPDFVTILPKDLLALQNTRTGALITAFEAKKFGWHVGDRIPLMLSTVQNDGSDTWVFDIVGMAAPGIKESTNIFANYDYVDAARALGKGAVSYFYVVAADPKQASALSATIDRTFANSPSPTRTQPLRALVQQQMRQIGNLNFVIRSVVSAVLVAVMFSIATMMMQTVRERTPELAVLKTLGFSDRAVVLLVVGEALMVCVGGALIGLGLAAGIFLGGEKFILGLSMPLIVFIFGVIGAVLISLVSVSLPASRAARFQVVDALSRR